MMAGAHTRSLRQIPQKQSNIILVHIESEHTVYFQKQRMQRF